jgi:hypothetical protein
VNCWGELQGVQMSLALAREEMGCTVQEEDSLSSDREQDEHEPTPQGQVIKRR